MAKQAFWRKSRFFVIFYALIAAGGMIFITFDWEFPLSVISTIWPVLISAYTVLDRFVDIRTTQNLPKGVMSMGELNKLIFIIFLCFFLFVESFVLTRFFDKNFCMGEFATAFGASIVTYVGGNKAIKGFKFSSPDSDKDGIPDSIQEEYYKWERQKRKERVSDEFINLGYFLDENEDLKKKI